MTFVILSTVQSTNRSKKYESSAHKSYNRLFFNFSHVLLSVFDNCNGFCEQGATVKVKPVADFDGDGKHTSRFFARLTGLVYLKKPWLYVYSLGIIK